MRALIQRVRSSRVEVGGEVVGEIGPGLLVLLGVGRGDTPSDAAYLAEKVASLRVFPGENGRMDLSVVDAGGSVLVVSQFTLYGDCSRGRRPSFDQAAPAEEALPLYREFIARLKAKGLRIAEGRFGAMMEVHLVNDGPVTLLIESPRTGEDLR